MPRQSTNQIIRCRYFRWIIRKRSGVYLADGRSNNPAMGRHSLGTRDKGEALERLELLDRKMAVSRGLADASILDGKNEEDLPLRDGWRQYLNHLRRPEVAGGVSPKTVQRYQAVFNKFSKFAKRRKLDRWQDVTTQVLDDYLRHLKYRGFGDRTQYLEGGTIKQIVKWLVGENMLPATSLIKLPLRKVRGTTTHCWTPEEVTAMVTLCRHDPNLNWLADVIVTLAHTGLRISELAALRWTDVDMDRGTISLTNDARRQTKNRRDRSLPIHSRLKRVLERLPRRADGLVFHGPRGGKIKPDTVRTVLVRRVIEPLKDRFPTPEGEIGFEHGRLHSFRHYFCTMAASRNVPEVTLMRWLGHQSSEMVRHYYHQNDGAGQRLMSDIDFMGG